MSDPDTTRERVYDYSDVVSRLSISGSNAITVAPHEQQPVHAVVIPQSPQLLVATYTSRVFRRRTPTGLLFTPRRCHAAAAHHSSFPRLSFPLRDSFCSSVFVGFCSMSRAFPFSSHLCRYSVLVQSLRYCVYTIRSFGFFLCPFFCSPLSPDMRTMGVVIYFSGECSWDSEAD